MDTLVADRFGDVTMFRTCEQCGCCSSACPITGVKNFNIRRIIRHIELDLVDEIAHTPFPWYCTTCGRCETVCPNGVAILDIIRPLRGITPQDYVPQGPPPCAQACPAEIDIPGYVRLIAAGKPEEACAVILEKVPFPGILGRVCMHPCETECRRGEVNAPIAICALKRYAADKAENIFQRIATMNEPTGYKVAVIGSGPAGLTAAFYLKKKGHDVTIYESRPQAGGMMRYGIPRYRLPEDILDQEIGRILSLGITLKIRQGYGADVTLDKLKEEGVEAVFIALGLQLSRKIELDGAESSDVLWGIDFLTDVSDGKEVSVKERVLVVGGGNVAVDVALTALRLGAREVVMACLEGREEMPANPREIVMAEEEGVILLPAWGPKRVICENGKISAIELVQCTSVFDEDGNFCPAFGETIKQVETDQVILAIGQAADISCIKRDNRLTVEKGLLATNPETLETDIIGVFAGGDVNRGPGSVIEAITAGRNAACSIDRFLGGDGNIEEPIARRSDTDGYSGLRERGFADRLRVDIPTLPREERRMNFQEVDNCLDDVHALEEANRCLQCDLEQCLPRVIAEKEGTLSC